MARETEIYLILEWKRLLMRIPNRHGITQKEEAPAEELEKVGDHHLLVLHRKIRGSWGSSRNSGNDHLSRYDVTTCHLLAKKQHVQ
jgi:hypothetical protein